MNNNIHIFHSADALATEFTKDFINLLYSKPFLNIAISGGNTPLLFFKKLAQMQQDSDWDTISFYWGDERCVPPDHEESNYKNAYDILFKKLPIPKENIHRIIGENFPRLEAVRYGVEMLSNMHTVKKIPVLDMLILGIGDDGHVASIFPDQISVFGSENIVEVTQHPETKQKRITITGKVIEKAHNVAFLVSGKNKAQVIKEIFEQSGDYMNYPAWFVQQLRTDVQWWLDTDAASLLDKSITDKSS